MNMPLCDNAHVNKYRQGSNFEEVFKYVPSQEISPEFGRTSRAYSASHIPVTHYDQHDNSRYYVPNSQINIEPNHRSQYHGVPLLRNIPRSYTSEFIQHPDSYHNEENPYYFNQNYNVYVPSPQCFSNDSLNNYSNFDYLSDHSIESYDSEFKSRASSSSIQYLSSNFPPIQEYFEEDNPFFMNPNHILKQCFQQQGCRKIQNALERNEVSVGYIISVLEQHYYQIMKDQFGNYLFQKVVQLMDSSQFRSMFQTVKGYFTSLLTDKHGTRSIQAVIKNCKDKLIFEDILNILTPYILSSCCNVNSYHIINLLITALPSSLRTKLIMNILGHFTLLCKNSYGCNVMQRCYEYSSNNEKNHILNLLMDNIDLVSDEHANYFVQYVITFNDYKNVSLNNSHSQVVLNNQDVVNKIFNKISGNIIDLSLHKASSNVVEKCVEYGNDKIKSSIIDKFIKSKNILMLIEHEFSNYVIQSLLKHSGSKIKENLTKVIESNKAQLMKSKIGKKVLALQ